MLEKQSSPNPKKKFGIPCILYFFIQPQPNKIGPARQQPRDWRCLFYFSESGRGRGAQLLPIDYYLLDYKGFAMEATTE